MLLTISLSLAALVVLWKTIEVCASIDIHNFEGSPLHFCAMAVYWAMFGAGAVAVAAQQPIGGAMLLLGVAIFCLANRRRSPHDHA